jgi:mRNA interferase MazF
MKKAEIWKAVLNDTKGSEQKGYRPVLIVSGNLLNTYAPILWVCPLTTKIKNYHGDLILEPNTKNGLIQQSEILTMHLRSLSKARLIEKLGEIELTQLDKVRNSLKELLEMD